MRRDGASRAGSVDNLAQRLAPGRLPESEKDLQSLGLCWWNAARPPPVVRL